MEEEVKESPIEDATNDCKVKTEINNHKNNKKKFYIIGLICLLILVGVIVFFITQKDKEESNEKTKKEKEPVTKQEKRTGKKMTIFKVIDKEDANFNYYDFDVNIEKGYKKEKVGTVTCLTNKCESGAAYLDYAIIEEEDGAYLINYHTDELVYGPFGIRNELLEIDGIDEYGYDYDVLTNNDANPDKINAIAISNNNKTTIFNLANKKEIKNLIGTPIEELYVDCNALIDYGYIVLTDDNQDEETMSAYLYNLNNGKLIKKYNNVISAAIYNKKPYILDTNADYSFTITDINGNKMFDNKKYTGINTENKNLILYDKNQFFVYSPELKLLKQSKKYTDILMAGKDFILVVDKTNLELVDLSDRLLTKFTDDYDASKDYVHSMLSGWYTENGKNGIYFVVQTDKVTIDEVLKANKDMTKDSLEGMDLGYEYYYIPKTKETGRIPTYIGGYAKPVLYLYPTKKTNVTVTFEKKELLTTTYPKFDKKWNVLVEPTGNMQDSKGRNYYGLYWEELGNHRVSFDTGFYVEAKDAIKFLEEKLAIIGLKEREANEFIMYWLPILEQNGKNLIYFELTEERDSYNKLIITPKPDSILRLAIHVKKVDKKINIKEQKLPTFKRTGFIAVEWGGVRY